MESVLPYDFTLNYGMRYTWVETDMDRAEGTRTSMGSSRPKETGSTGSTSESRPVFNVGLVWTGIDDLALRATFSQGFRVPISRSGMYFQHGGRHHLPQCRP